MKTSVRGTKSSFEGPVLCGFLGLWLSIMISFTALYRTEAGKIMTRIRFWNLKAESYKRSLTQENEKILENTDFTKNQFGVFYESL